MGRYVVLAAASTLLVLTFARLSSFGIWDPWELSAADLARQLAVGEVDSVERPVLPVWLVGLGFRMFGIHEWAGRFPIGLAGLVAALLAGITAARFAGRRAGWWAAVIAGTSPLFLLNAREMLGATPGFAASAGVFLCAMSAVFVPADLRLDARAQNLRRGLWLAGLVLSAGLATLANGALTGVAPPLLAVSVATIARGELARPWLDVNRARIAAGVLGIAGLVLAGCIYAVYADYEGFGYWTGGVPRGGDPPTWEVAIERLFHSFAPWSGLLPVAFAQMLASPPNEPGRDAGRVAHPEERALRLATVSWIALAATAQTLFNARYGTTGFLALGGAAILVALLLRDVERSGKGWPVAAIVGFLMVGLIIRDYGEYPSGPVEGLPLEGLEVPANLNLMGAFASMYSGEVPFVDMRIGWAAVLGLFALTVALGLGVDPSEAHEPLRAELRGIRESFRQSPVRGLWPLIALGIPHEMLRAQWQRGMAFRVWIVLSGLAITALVSFGLACWVAPDSLAVALRTTSLAIKVGRVLVLLPIGVWLAILVGRFGLFGFSSLGEQRTLPILITGVLVGLFTSLIYQPALSTHFSPREVYDTYNDLASAGEPLGEFRVGGRAAAYYAEGDIVELATEAELLQFLGQDGRVWAAFRADDLASLNRGYRRAHGSHLFVADARSERMILATNRPIEGRDNQNYLADAVLDEPPRIQFPVTVNFDDRVTLLGYDLELPHEGYVGPGEAFTVTWYFRVTAPVGGNYQIFLHVDGPGQRIHGDHEPVDGHYPVRLWEAGDIVVDRQELRVPANYARGSLTFYLGFYAGDTRLTINSGPSDGENRARAGSITVR